MTPKLALNTGALRALYRSGEARPSDVVAALYDRIQAEPLQPVWISMVPREVALAQARKLERDPLGSARPLYGIPFAIKDNIDLAGLPTTAGCPGFSYSPSRSATAVGALVDAGAIPIGKTNLDQFATGLVGTRSPYGACSSVYDERYISGGSSSGSAVAVAAGLVSFALGTDTAGSGRVPAAFNNLIGMKPTRGLVSTSGVVPACRSLDCVSILSQTAHDAHTVWQVLAQFDESDPFSRAPYSGQGAAPWCGGSFRFGVPSFLQLEFFGDTAAAALYEQAIATLESLGGYRVEIDYTPFRDAADFLYSGPWVAERLAAIGPFLESHPEQVNPVVREIISGGGRYTAVDAFQAEYRLRGLRRETEAQWESMDLLVLPTTGTMYTHQQVADNPIGLNTNLGYYTNFANLLDLAVVAVPAGFRPTGLPFGISLIGPAFHDEALLALADQYHAAHTSRPEPSMEPGPVPPDCVSLAVVGAHLTGQPLNRQLTDLGARRIKTCRTAPGYRLYALDSCMPPKPGLVRDDSFAGPGIEVEIWAVPQDRFGGFVAAIPAPLSIGTVVLDNGESVKCFLCEPYALSAAHEITQFGGWRAYLSQAVHSR